MKQFRIRLNSRGFSHVELLVVVVLVVAVALTGVFVYKHDNKSGTAHAGSWTYLGSTSNDSLGVTISAYACLQKIALPSGGYTYNVEGMFEANHRITQSLWVGIDDWSVPTGVQNGTHRWWIASTSWNSQQVHVSHNVNLAVPNYISASFGTDSEPQIGWGNDPHAGSLAPCN